MTIEGETRPRKPQRKPKGMRPDPAFQKRWRRHRRRIRRNLIKAKFRPRGRIRQRGNFQANTITLDIRCVGAFAPFPKGTYKYSNPAFETCRDETHKGPPYRSGGPLNILKRHYIHAPSAAIHLQRNDTSFVEGQFLSGYFGANPTGGGQPSLPPLFKNDSSQAKLWNKARPGNPLASAGQFLIELHQIPTIPFQLHRLRNLPAKLKKELLGMKNLGNEHLNVQFGWLPFLKDLRQMYNTSIDLHKSLDQLRRDNGKTVHRRARLPGTHETSTVSTVHSNGSNMYPILHPVYYSATPGHRDVITTTYTDEWFEASFRYWIPDIGSPNWTKRATAALFGISPTPSLLWEVLPWSWLSDWFGNVGDVLANLSQNAAENLVAKYAYYMASSETRIYVSDTTYLTGNLQVSASAISIARSKYRTAASPFGFGLTSASLTAKQASILGALGISRMF